MKDKNYMTEEEFKKYVREGGYYPDQIEDCYNPLPQNNKIGNELIGNTAKSNIIEIEKNKTKDNVTFSFFKSTDFIEGEVWKIYEGIYFSNLGRRIHPILLRPEYIKSTDNGYAVMRFNHKKIKIHRIIAELFLEEFTSDCVIHHKNGIRSDNRAENLECTTQAINMLYKDKDWEPFGKICGQMIRDYGYVEAFKIIEQAYEVKKKS